MGAPEIRAEPDALPALAEVFAALPDPVVVLGPDGRMRMANNAAEQFFAASEAVLNQKALEDLIARNSPLLALASEARRRGRSISEYGIELAFQDGRQELVDAHAKPLDEAGDYLLLTLLPRSVADAISRQLTHRGAARSVAGVAAMLAHEIKNPLSGIRGAAQLLEDMAGRDEKALAQLICTEADRIVALVDQMEMFSDNRPLKRAPVNIHRVLDHVIALAKAGFAAGVDIQARYDPSLPPVDGNWDLLVQAFLNLVKNAAEAAPADGGEILLSTGYRHGVRVGVPGSNQRLNLPIEVVIVDNGPGIPEDIRAHLFDPFVTTKPNGKGLGLALVSKAVGDHGGVIDCESRPRRTAFHVLLPAAQGGGE